MKKLRKVLAIVLAMAMVMGMSIVSLAKSTTGSITVSGLAKESTTVTIYKIISLGDNDNSWVVAKDVPSTAVDLTQNPAIINLEEIDSSKLTADKTDITSTGTVTFNGLEEGAYLVIAKSNVSGSLTTYNKMVGVTYKYDETTGIITGKNATITAKSSTIDVDKTASTNFVGVGSEVTFTITTTFPSFYTSDGNNTTGTYKIVDEPVGMNLTQVVSVKVGNTELEAGDNTYSVSEDLKTVEFKEKYIGNQNAHAGEKVEITYKGIVTNGDIYSNSAQAYKDGQKIGTGNIPDHYTGTIEFTKYAEGLELNEDGTVKKGTKLVGAEFKVEEEIRNEDGTTTDKLLYFVKTGDGAYKQVPEGTKNAVSQVEVASTGNNKGTVSITYLEAGTYKITEVVAPDGYKVDSEPKTVIITADETANVTVDSYMSDTKLSALPSTGGIGTTIFTIVGCLLMIGAASILFVSRRRASK